MVGPFKVTSLANGTFLISAAWQDYGTRGCGPVIERDADDQCRRCHMPHIGGFMDRMATAKIIERLLNRMAKPAARKTRR